MKMMPSKTGNEMMPCYKDYSPGFKKCIGGYCYTKHAQIILKFLISYWRWLGRVGNGEDS